MGPCVNIDGKLYHPDEAKVSVFDRGFLYGDSVYETIRVYAGRPFKFSQHCVRLYASGKRIGFKLPWSELLLRERLRTTLEAAGLTDCVLRVVATRGSGQLGLDPGLAVHPKLIVYVLELPQFPARFYHEGCAAHFTDVKRNIKQAVDPQAKTGNYINNLLALSEAKASGADDAIMLDVEGRVAEASTANIFVHVDGAWQTPPLDVGILGGITRQTIMDLLKKNNIEVRENVLWPEDLHRAEEIFLCSSLREIVPVARLGDRVMQQQEKCKTVMALYQQYVERLAKEPW